MEETAARTLICATGRELLGSGLVARTWGNVSCRLDEDRFLITPSGLDYTITREEDIVLMRLSDMSYTGKHKPSSEKGIHAAAYNTFAGARFVIHTHQTCASALGLAGFDTLAITPKERERLGGVALARYGLPGTKKLKNAVLSAMQSGAQTVLMAAHGVVTCGKDKDEAMERVQLLEDICRRSLAYKALLPKRAGEAEISAALAAAKAAYPFVDMTGSDPVVALANAAKPLFAQLDDMAQMLGRSIPAVPLNGERIVAALKKHDAALVFGLGAVIRSGSADDTAAQALLIEKAAVAALHTAALGKRARLGLFDVSIMRYIYKQKYSKQKGQANE